MYLDDVEVPMVEMARRGRYKERPGALYVLSTTHLAGSGTVPLDRFYGEVLMGATDALPEHRSLASNE
jgi:hypothetical protein